MNFAHSQASGMMSASHIERLARSRRSAPHRIRWHSTAGTGHPGKSLTHQHLVVRLRVLRTTVGHIGASLARYDLGGKILAFVKGSTHIDGRAVRVMATDNRVWGQGAVWRRVHPGVVCKEKGSRAISLIPRDKITYLYTERKPESKFRVLSIGNILKLYLIDLNHCYINIVLIDIIYCYSKKKRLRFTNFILFQKVNIYHPEAALLNGYGFD